MLRRQEASEMNMDDSVTQRVMLFVSKTAGVNIDQLNPDTTLFADIGLDGADAWELMDAFGREFNVNLSDFEFDDYFGPEGIWFGPWIIVTVIRRLLVGEPHVAARKRPISIRDLVLAAETK